MTLNVNATPNRLCMTGDVTVGTHFGPVQSVTPICIEGQGHRPHVDVRFAGGLRLELDQAAVVELARRFPEALARLPFLPDVHDACLDQDDETGGA
ncbi:Uncharacterised protein [Mycolicibacterium vanbaalenii]|uniref:Uncharacterized protein n=1 Tax=Mycolicibacterium vanbaalenii TaxID=110539 RepID=A0A5S9R6C1_MYCVN|nr:hypothetical protein [Mycolicibacterium vanbaalenii]CAA0129274.1 Uncharacterised protein [Mycolicibacterium vanbaalenii]